MIFYHNLYLNVLIIALQLLVIYFLIESIFIMFIIIVVINDSHSVIIFIDDSIDHCFIAFLFLDFYIIINLLIKCDSIIYQK